jgi:hypothetical protein
MDMHDRWGREAVFFWDEEDYGGLKPPSTPDWLEGIRCYFEGTPDHEVFLYDYYWTELDDILLEPATPFRTKPQLVLLLGDEFNRQLNNEAEFDKFCARHPLYKWRRHEGVLLSENSAYLLKMMDDTTLLNKIDKVKVAIDMDRRSTGLDKVESNPNAVNIAVLGDIGMFENEANVFKKVKPVT